MRIHHTYIFFSYPKIFLLPLYFFISSPILSSILTDILHAIQLVITICHQFIVFLTYGKERNKSVNLVLFIVRHLFLLSLPINTRRHKQWRKRLSLRGLGKKRMRKIKTRIPFLLIRHLRS